MYIELEQLAPHKLKNINPVCPLHFLNTITLSVSRMVEKFLTSKLTTKKTPFVCHSLY